MFRRACLTTMAAAVLLCATPLKASGGDFLYGFLLHPLLAYSHSAAEWAPYAGGGFLAGYVSDSSPFLFDAQGEFGARFLGSGSEPYPQWRVSAHLDIFALFFLARLGVSYAADLRRDEHKVGYLGPELYLSMLGPNDYFSGVINFGLLCRMDFPLAADSNDTVFMIGFHAALLFMADI